MKTLKTIFWTLVVAGLLAGGVGLVILYSGVYDIAANEPHLGVVRWALTTGQRNAVEEHAEGIVAPPLHDAALIRRGFVLYQDNCLVCHGAPGVARDRIGRGMNPNPPPLYMAASEWSDAELYWIIRHGLKMAGYGCGSCHVIPGVDWARGKAGPPLTRWAERHFIAGELVNNPANLVTWIVDPQQIEPGTAMPALGVTPEEALDIAAYLFTLGDPPREWRDARAESER